MASSSYYRSQMNQISARLNSRRKRRSTCEAVLRNLGSDTSYGGITNSMLSGADYLAGGLRGAAPLGEVLPKLREDREKTPGIDSHLRSALDALQSELAALDRQIDTLQQQYNSAQWNYNAAKDREWQETLDRLQNR